MASQLPKRTDNEIKNYWNTVLKKRLQKESLNNLVFFETRGTLSQSAVSEARPKQDTKGTQRQDNQKNVKSSAGSASKKLSCNRSKEASAMSCLHLSQWESARLEAEARLGRESQSSQKTHALFPFTAAATAFSTSSNQTHANPQPLTGQTLPSSSCNPGCLVKSRQALSSTTDTLLSGNASTLSLPCRCAGQTNTSSTSKSTSSMTSLSSLFSQENITSGLTFGSNGRLSWQAKEVAFAPSSPTSQCSLISQMLCQIENHHNGSKAVITEPQAMRKDGGLKGEDVLREGQEDLSLEEATSSIMLDLNSSDMESSSLESWHDFILDVENSCSDVVSSTTLVTTSPPEERFSCGALASCMTTPSEPLCSSTLDFEDHNFESLISCEHYDSSQHHSNLLILKELLWDALPSQ